MNTRDRQVSLLPTRRKRTFCWSGLLLGLVLLPVAVSLGATAQTKAIRRAEKFLRMGQYQQAEEVYRALLVRNHRNLKARLGLSYTHLKKGELDDAYRQAAVVVAEAPLDARAHAIMGMALLRSGIFHRSMGELTTAVMLDHREALALAGLAEIDLFENRTKLAHEKLRQATRYDPDEPEYWITFGRAAARLEQFEEAAGHYERFLAIAPKLDEEKRALYRGLIGFYYALSRNSITNLHRVEGPKRAVISFQLQNARPFIPVRINGKATPLSFVVDTGASITVLSQRAAKELGIPIMARGGRARAFGGTGKFPVIYGLVNLLQIDEVKLYNVPVYIRPFRHFRQGRLKGQLQPDGFLGLSVLSNFRLTLDYGHRKLILTQPTQAEAEDNIALGITSVPFRSTNGGLVSIEARLGDAEVRNFLVDSAASATVLAEGVVTKMNWQDRVLPNLKARVLGAAGVLEKVDLMLLPSLTISDLEMRNIRSPVLDMGLVNESAGFLQSGIIGGRFLKHFRVTFDFQQYRVIFVPQTEAIRRVDPEPVVIPPKEQSED